MEKINEWTETIQQIGKLRSPETQDKLLKILPNYSSKFMREEIRAALLKEKEIKRERLKIKRAIQHHNKNVSKLKEVN